MDHNQALDSCFGIPLPALKRIDDVCQRFESEWVAGDRPQVVDFLGGFDGTERSVLVVELLKVEVVYRRCAGETPCPADYATLLNSDAVKEVFGDNSFGTTMPLTPRRSSSEAFTECGDAPGLSTALPTVPGFTLLGVLGAGGMGIVYRAVQGSLNRPVALKMIQRLTAGPAEQARFRREAEAAARVEHENIVRVFDLGEIEGRPFISMELVEGGNLQERISEAVPPLRIAAELVKTLAAAVQAAHAREVIHRDLKPANILLAFADGEEGKAWWQRRYTPKVADFGLAKWSDAPEYTMTGDIFGTPAYMAPEQADGRGKDASVRTDVYALGAILYALLTGRPPFAEPTRAATISKVVNEPPTPPRRLRREIHPDLEAVCLRCLEKSLARRYASATELADDLGRFLNGEPTHARPRRWYQKVGRAIARRPLMTAAACLVTLAAAMMPFIEWKPDPDAARKELKAKFVQGKPYTFTGDEKLPGPFRRVFFGGSDPRANVAEGCFTIESLGPSLWELIDVPPVLNYAITADIRHDAAKEESVVGLYFGYRFHSNEQGRRMGALHSLTFADRGRRADRFKDKDKNPVTRVQFATHVFEELPTRLYFGDGPCGNGIQFRPAFPAGQPAPWRTLRIEVRANRARALWFADAGEMKVVNDYPAEKFEFFLNETKEANKRFAEVSGKYLPQASCGLYVFSGKASFRRIIVEPLDNQ